MQIKKIITLALLALFIGGSLFAQPPGGRRGKGNMPGDRKEMKERIETIKMLKLTEMLALDEDQSVRFFARYREYNDARMEEFKTLREIEEALEDAIKAGAEDSEIKKIMNELYSKQPDLKEQEKKFIESQSDILSRTQMAKLMMFEHRFHDRMHELVRDMVAPPPPPDREGGRPFPPQGD